MAAHQGFDHVPERFVLTAFPLSQATRFDFYLADLALLRADGTVHAMYSGAPRATASEYSWHNGSIINRVWQNYHGAGVGATYLLTTSYYHGDHLGSSRLLTSAYGMPVWQTTYLPFGEEHQQQPTPNNYKFTGKERDTESGLDYFGARYYGSSLGRFTTPDPLLIKREWLVDPQKLNRYSYVANRPLAFIDPDGLDATIVYSTANLTLAQAKWFEENKGRLFAAIKKKLNDVGVTNVTFKAADKLSKGDLERLATAPLQSDPRRTGTPGVVRLEIVGDQSSFNPRSAPLGTPEQTHAGIAAVFLDNLLGREAMETGSAACNAVCGVANAAAHGIGHAFGFDDPGHGLLGEWTGLNPPPAWFRDDVMKANQNPFKRPLPYRREPNLQAVEEVNRAKPFPED